MRLTRIAVIALLVITLVSTVACSSKSETDQQNQADYGQAYSVVKDEIQNVVIGYATDHQGNWPTLTGTYSISGCTNCHIIDMSLLLTSQGGFLSQVPDGTYSAAGANNDNCDGGASGCSSNNHYVWLIDWLGNVYSKCIGSDCDGATGYQGIWP